MPSFRGRPACTCLVKWLPVYEAELKRRGIIRKSIDIYQLIGGAKASGGTHAGGGAYDLAQYSDEAIKVAREMGAAAWARTKAQGFSPNHQHGVLNDCPHNAAARYQVTALTKGYNGLGRAGMGASDDGPSPRRLRTWREGIAWAKQQGRQRLIAGLPVPRIRYVVDHPDGATTYAGPGKDYPEVRHYPQGYTFTANWATKHYRRHAKPAEWFPAARLGRAKKK